MKKTLFVDGMTCGHCVKAVKGALGHIDGVKNVEVDLDTKEVVVEGENLDNLALKVAIEEAGYELLETK